MKRKMWMRRGKEEELGNEGIKVVGATGQSS